MIYLRWCSSAAAAAAAVVVVVVYVEGRQCPLFVLLTFSSGILLWAAVMSCLCVSFFGCLTCAVYENQSFPCLSVCLSVYCLRDWFLFFFFFFLIIFRFDKQTALCQFLDSSQSFDVHRLSGTYRRPLCVFQLLRDHFGILRCTHRK